MGRQLSSVQRSGAGSVNFTYNSDGLRTSKTVAGNTVRYTWIGDKITSEVGNGNALYFYYDLNNTPVAVMLNGTLYYYVTNLQGDIIAMLDETGTAVVEYSYDAWGNTEITDFSSYAKRQYFRVIIMEIISKNKYAFDRSIYASEHSFIISNQKYWDGGFDESASLDEKSEFYNLAKQFSDIVKHLITSLDDVALTGSYFCERYDIFEWWKDKKNYDCFNNVLQHFKRNKQYQIMLPEDNELIDLIIENNFRYLTCFDLFLPKKQIVLKPTCHTEVVVYANNSESLDEAQRIAKEYEKFSNWFGGVIRY